ncbi:MAG: hypothetical protein H6735_29985 [Alphaproteobacteria bacterium]|nr:hypothetical protein [Alphaproteobacteria bacterium]
MGFPYDVDLIEAHGTSTLVWRQGRGRGVNDVGSARSIVGQRNPIRIGSVKSMIGHPVSRRRRVRHASRDNAPRCTTGPSRSLPGLCDARTDVPSMRIPLKVQTEVPSPGPRPRTASAAPVVSVLASRHEHVVSWRATPASSWSPAPLRLPDLAPADGRAGRGLRRPPRSRRGARGRGPLRIEAGGYRRAHSTTSLPAQGHERQQRGWSRHEPRGALRGRSDKSSFPPAAPPLRWLPR